MEVTNVINLALMFVTAVGVVVAVVQAREARSARDDARAARDQAEQFEKRAVTASETSAKAAERSADAQEKMADLYAAQMPTDEWVLIPHGGDKYEVRNETRSVLFGVILDELGDSTDITPLGETVTDQVGPGESLFFLYSKTYDSPAQTTLQVSWGDPMTGERSNWRRTIS